MVYQPEYLKQKEEKVKYNSKADASAKVSALNSAKEVNVDDLIGHIEKKQERANKNGELDNAFYGEDEIEDINADNIEINNGLFGMDLEEEEEIEDTPKQDTPITSTAKEPIEFNADIPENTETLEEEVVEEEKDFNSVEEFDYDTEDENLIEETEVDETPAQVQENSLIEEVKDFDTTNISETYVEEPDDEENNYEPTIEDLEDNSTDLYEETEIPEETESNEESEEPAPAEFSEFNSDALQGEPEEENIVNEIDFDSLYEDGLDTIEEEIEVKKEPEEEPEKEITEDDIDLSNFGVEDITLQEEVEISEEEQLSGIQDLFDTAPADNTPMDLYTYKQEEPEEDEEVPEVRKTVKKQEPVVDNSKKKVGLFKSKNQSSEPVTKIKTGRSSIDKIMAKLQDIMASYRSRGCSIVFTGGSSSGKTVASYNLAKLIVSMGYNVLIVDFDTKTKAQGIISKQSFDAVHSMDAENPSLKQAINANNNITKYTNIVEPGLHLLTLGLGADMVSVDDLLSKQKIAKFSSNVRNAYNFIIYDIPFEYAVGYCDDVTSTADALIVMADYSTKGLMELLVKMSNIESEEMQETMFTRTMLCLNKFSGYDKMFNKKVKRTDDILKEMDNKIKDLLGVEAEYQFRDMHLVKPLNYDKKYDDCWLSEKAYIDFPDGKIVYTELLGEVLLNEWSV
jgi:Mrp family chromosome partitioning ATPase